MSDIHKPDDPYGLLGEHWPEESETSYTDAESDCISANNTTVEAAGDCRHDAGQVGEEFKGKTGTAVSDKLTAAAADLDTHATDLKSLANAAYSAAVEIKNAKNLITDQVSAGTAAIKQARELEANGQSPSESSASLVEKYRAKIAGLKTDYDAAMKTAITAPEQHQPARFGRYSDENVAYAGASSTARRDELSHEQGKDYQRLVDDPQEDTEPTVEHRPTAPGTSNPVPTTPLSNAAPVQQQAQSGVPTTPLNSTPATQGHGGVPSTPLSSSASGSASSAQHSAPPAQATGREAPRRDSSTPIMPLPSTVSSTPSNTPVAAPITRLSSSESPQEAVRAALSELRADRPAGTMSNPVATTPLNSTPPVAAPSTPVVAPQALASGSPVPLAPVTPPSSTPQAVSPVAPTPQPERRSGERTDPGAFVGLVGQPKEEKKVTEVERQNIKQQDEPQSFINTLSMPEALAHRALSSLRAEFERTGWAQPLAVAVVRVEHGLLMVYATADGASIWPSRVQLPEDMTPLADLVDVPPVLWGSTDPAVKLICLAHAGLRIEALLGNSEGTALVVQTAEQHAELQATGDVLPAVRSRSEGSDIEPSDVTRAERLVWDAPRVLDPEEAGKRLRALRWTDSQPAAYEAAHGDWVIAEIASSLANQNLASAIYLADQAFVQLHDNENPN